MSITALRFLARLAWQRTAESLRSLWPVVVILFAYQVFVLGSTIEGAGTLLVGLVLMLAGLVLFLEGLRMGLMPLAEHIGGLLPEKLRLGAIMFVAFALGWGATLAEPAISALEFAAPPGIESMPEHPLHNMLLPHAIGCGVGIGLMLGMIKIYHRLPLYHLVLPTVMIGLALAILSESSGSTYIHLAWDAGAVTTGPVTVPIILALGLGLSQVMPGEGRSGLEGLGLVTLASLWPIIMVLMLGLTR